MEMATGVKDAIRSGAEFLRDTALHSNGHTKLDEPGIIVFSHLRWNFVWQRPQQFLSRFGEKHPILFVEEPMWDLAAGEQPRAEIQEVQANITTLVPHMPAGATKDELDGARREMVRDALKSHPQSNRFQSPLLWYYSPMDAAWSLGYFNSRGIIYDCMDELSLFAGAPAELVEQEARLIKNADIVFAGGKDLSEKKREQHSNVHFFGCGVEYQHFAQAQDSSKPLPADVAELPRPVIGWFGVIDERMDYDLVKEMAEARPDWSFVLVGPVVKVDPASLPQAPNLYWVGQRDYKELPDYCRAYDVCMMPFALNDATRYINPTKALEYLATGRPVISTPVNDVVSQYTGTIAIAKNAQEFVRAIENALENDQSQHIAAGVSRARECSWESTVAQMEQLIKDAIKH